MKESSTYQAIVEEGRVEGRAEAAVKLQEIVEVLGGKRFGPPDASHHATIHAMNDLDALTRLTERLMDVESWDELLGTP
jgi:hypothetical protein